MRKRAAKVSPPSTEETKLAWRLKSAPVDSLTHFMATVLCNIKDMHSMATYQVIVKNYNNIIMVLI